MSNLLFAIDVILTVFLVCICVSICAILLAGGYAVIRGVVEGLRQSKTESEKNGH